MAANFIFPHNCLSFLPIWLIIDPLQVAQMCIDTWPKHTEITRSLDLYSQICGTFQFATCVISKLKPRHYFTFICQVPHGFIFMYTFAGLMHFSVMYFLSCTLAYPQTVNNFIQILYYVFQWCNVLILLNYDNQSWWSEILQAPTKYLMSSPRYG